MKKYLLPAVLLIVALWVSNPSQGQDLASIKTSETESIARTLGTNIIQGKDDRFSIKIIYENYLQGKVIVELSSKDGSTSFFRENRSDTKYMRTFNMGNLPAGDYQIVVTNGKDTATRYISITSQKGKRNLTMM